MQNTEYVGNFADQEIIVQQQLSTCKIKQNLNYVEVWDVNRTCNYDHSMFGNGKNEYSCSYIEVEFLRKIKGVVQFCRELVLLIMYIWNCWLEF